MKTPTRLLGPLILAAILAGCSTNAMTGRSQLSLVSDDQVSKESLTYYTSMMGDFRKDTKLVQGTAMNERVERITNRLIQQAVLFNPKSATWKWEVNVIDDPKTVNAFCMPGGLMAIYTGLIQQLNATDDEIAQVMGHEIGHALAGHGAEKMSVDMATKLGVGVLSVAAATQTNSPLAMQGLTLAGLTFVTLPNSRGAETEADRIGIELAARAGYNPAAAVSLWQKMAGDGKSSRPPQFMSTHPAPEQRQETLAALNKQMTPLYAEALAKKQVPYDWLRGSVAGRPVIDPAKAQSFAPKR